MDGTSLFQILQWKASDGLPGFPVVILQCGLDGFLCQD